MQNGPRYGRSILVPEPDVDRPNIARIVQKLPPVLSPTIPRNDVEAFRVNTLKRLNALTSVVNTPAPVVRRYIYYVSSMILLD